MKRYNALGGRALLVALTAGSLAACSVHDTRTPARLVIQGSPERIEAFLASQTSRLETLRSAPDDKGRALTVLTLTKGTSSEEVTRLMTRAIEAKLSVSYTQGGAKRTFRLG